MNCADPALTMLARHRRQARMIRKASPSVLFQHVDHDTTVGFTSDQLRCH
jgi:hypothetical protein